MSNPIAGVRRLTLLPALAAALLLAACAAPSPTATTGAGGDGDCVTADANNVVQLSAANIAFSTTCIEVPAGTAFTIEFTNSDSAPHDVAIFEDDTKATELFKGDVTEAGQSATYEVDALEEGEYYFECTIHPAMNGTVRAVAS